jgi:2-succinyl-6-hydroxy-2,4-cyclohexadiene-1-carboxylate synthase
MRKDSSSLHTGAALHYQTAGAPHQPPLCFVHGFMGSSEDWCPLIGGMDEQAFCLGVDLPGHGHSLDCPAHVYSMEGATQALADVLDAAGIHRCTLVGYSMGGRVALYFALFHPERVRRLVLESASPGLPTEAERAERRALDEQRAQRIEENLGAFLDDWYRQPLFASLERHGLVEEMVRRRRANDPDGLARALRGLSPGAQPSLWNRLPDLSVPTLVLTGARDDKYRAVTERTADRLPDARRAVVPGAGHNVHAERPQAFLAQLGRFLRAT